MKLKEMIFKSFPPPDFRTHMNYVSCLNKISKDLSISLLLNIKTKSDYDSKKLKKKLDLIKLIKKSLDEEYKFTIKNEEFAEIGSTWIAVKSYYLIFNMCLIVCFLINDEEKNLNLGHKNVLNNIKKLIKEKKIIFNKKEFNEFHICKEALKFRLSKNESLRLDLEDNKRISSILKKIAEYKLENFKREENIENFRFKINQNKRNDFIKKEETNLYEFFYCYRIKANYRDLDFLNQEIHQENFFDFYKNYYELTMNFYEAFKGLINNISKIRLGEKIL